MRSNWRTVAVVLCLPLVLWLVNDEWAYDAVYFRDNNINVGLFLHYLEQEFPYADNYKSSRLPYVLPHVAFYRLLPPVAAHHLGGLLFLALSAVAACFAMRKDGTGAVLFAGVMVSGGVFFHAAPSYHNTAAVAFLLLAACAIRAERLSHRTAALLAGLAMGAAITTTTVAAALVPWIGIMAVARTRGSVRDTVGCAIYGAAGAVAALVLQGLVSVACGGPFFSFFDQLNLSMRIAETEDYSYIALSALPGRFHQHPHQLIPLVATVAAVAVLVHAARQRDPGRDLERGALGLGWLVSLAIVIAMQVGGNGALELDHVLTPFLAPAVLVIASTLAGIDVGDGWRARWAAVALVGVPLALGGGWVARQLATAKPGWWGSGAVLALFFAFAAIGVFVVLRRRRPVLALFAAVAGYGAVNVVFTPEHQPAFVYDWREQCTFRADHFNALIAFDAFMEPLDPHNTGLSSRPREPRRIVKFDGKGFCTDLPYRRIPGNALLTRYFDTSDEIEVFTHPRPDAKVLVVADTSAKRARARADTMELQFPYLKFAPRKEIVIEQRTFRLAVVVRDVVRR